MKHARSDYDRIQDPAGLIHDDEPVFLLRGQDICAPQVVLEWADAAEALGVDPKMVEAARMQAARMADWQSEYGQHVPDAPADVLPIHGERK